MSPYAGIGPPDSPQGERGWAQPEGSLVNTMDLPRREAVLAGSTARLLQACAGAAGSTGLLCAAGALAGLLLRAPMPAAACCAAALALLPLERLLWLRVRFDAGLFTDLAQDLWSDLHTTGAAAASAGSALDAALHALHLRGPAAAEPASARSLTDRAHGAQRLALRHGAVAVAQLALLASALALGVHA